MMDLKAVEALSELEKALSGGDGVSYDDALVFLRAAPELLALAKEALAARALVEPCAKLIVRLHDQEHPDIDDAADKILAHRALVSQHQSGGVG